MDRGEDPPADVYCRTRDIAVARVDTVRSLAEQGGADSNTAALVAAIAGELTNNCTGTARLVFESPITPDRLPSAIQPAEVTVPGTYAALTVPDIRHTLATL